VGEIPTLRIRDRTAPAGTDARKGGRRVWFRHGGETDAAIWNRARMPAGFVAAGPAVIESLESTILVPPAWQAAMSDDCCVLLTRASSPSPHSSSEWGEGRGEGRPQASAQASALHPNPLPAKKRGEGTRAVRDAKE